MSRTVCGVLAAFLFCWVVYFLVFVAAMVLGAFPLSLLVMGLKDVPIPTSHDYWFDVGLKWLKGAALASAALGVVMVINALWIEKTTTSTKK
jgi:ABC-type spermidine/putrescine transport system permease subunit I